VSIPAHTWKIIVVLDREMMMSRRINDSTRVIAVDMPNNDSSIDRNDDWKTFRVSIDEIEPKKGFDFLSNIPLTIQHVLESAFDTQ